jgi:alkanesulfonate monooxygenase SsuD/methylene tetrahydromethanopterin reductase-like flavin-dependent oxidoreductase (luciferase family)
LSKAVSAAVNAPIRGIGVSARASSWRTTMPRLGVEIFKHDLALPDAAVTVEYILDRLVICGSVASVVDQLLAFRDAVGDFGTLLYCGHDWADPRLARRSMELMAEKVMPAVNAAIGRSVRIDYRTAD